MLISEKWLREWAPVDLSHEQLCAKLTMLGLEIGTVEQAAPLFGDKVVVGYIEQALPHENADRLQLCKVNVGQSEPLDIVCGASNARQGLYVAVALEGAKLPALEVMHTQIRGVDSYGMLCSMSELGMTEHAEGIAELEEYPLGVSIDSYFDSDDSILEVELTPNRGDCLSALGIARDMAAVSALPMPNLPDLAIGASIESRLPIDLIAAQDCPRYVGRVIENIDMTAKTPVWMRERLRRSQVRSINAIVDVTNYVMLEFGQPMHAFDLDKIQGGIVVRKAQQGEQLALLDDSEVTLNDSHLVIADHVKAIALAGIMGGANSCVDDNTAHIYLEAAFFTPSSIAGRARAFGKHTDSSHRFERGVDFAIQHAAIQRATQLILEIAGGEAGPLHSEENAQMLPQIEAIPFQASLVKRMLGIEIDAKHIERILTHLGMTLTQEQKDEWMVTPPSWRFDVRGAHDLVEEIGRCYGFDAIQARLPLAQAPQTRISESQIDINSVKTTLTQKGYFEAINYSFVDPKWQQQILGEADEISLTNPIADNMSVMRRSLLPGLLANLRGNLHRQHTQVKLFETGNVFYYDANAQIAQTQVIAGVVYGDGDAAHWSSVKRGFDFFDIKGDALSIASNSLKNRLELTKLTHAYLHPGQGAMWQQQQQIIGNVGKIHPALAAQCDLPSEVYLFEWQLAPLLHKELPLYQAISRFPTVQRDLALIVDRDLPMNKLVESVKQAAGDLLIHFDLFDMYQGEHIEKNKKSLAFRFTFQANNASLKAEEVDQIQTKILQHLYDTHAAQLRA